VVTAAAVLSGFAGSSDALLGMSVCVGDFGRFDGDSLRRFALGYFNDLRRSERQPAGRYVCEITPDEHDGDNSACDGVSSQSADYAGRGPALGLRALLPLGDFEQPVIGRALLAIAQDGVGANNTPESFRSFRVAGIEIGVVRLGCFAERSPQAFGVIVRKRPEQIVESLHDSTLKYRYFPPVPPHRHFLGNQSAVKTNTVALKRPPEKSLTRIEYRQNGKTTTKSRVSRPVPRGKHKS
jgi:hypothetical protein